MTIKTNLKPLGMKLEQLKNANMLNAKERADAAMNETLQVLTSLDKRIERVEKSLNSLENI